MKVSIIAAMSSNHVIGRDNELPWKLKPDLQRFKQLTMGGALIVGRRTFESIGRLLPGRTTIVVTRQPGYEPAGVTVVHSIDEALHRAPGDEAFVAGGADIYRQTLDRADRLYLTMLERQYEGDAFFPEIDPLRWRLVSEERHPAQEGRPGFRFQTYDKSN